ncbi:metallophosphoesterase family protein [Afifella sp. IM 167]|uniref:metallophosphoesterase family protein n=1 Tax=Afifella sp. IM 167 TaxID=2033586 RepID=UPI001CC9F9B8|nr:metallophosphoesterase family protein [Afifella sp. IM 167]MBZ8135277.1 hypothetical protein [Afifella sp. IM 167]
MVAFPEDEDFSRFSVPEGCRVYAFGDIHGRFDLLGELHQAMEADLQARPVDECVEVFVGDYVDRGPDSEKVLRFLADSSSVCGRRVCLKGNHEDILIRALREPELLTYWLGQGGAATMLSFGVEPPRNARPATLENCRDALAMALGPDLSAFLGGLDTMERIGDYLFVHAGINPGRPLEEQEEQDLVWIREPFLSSQKDFGFCVVHGHTPRERQRVHANRINLDTGAFSTGILTCVALERSSRRFLATKRG